MLKFEEKKCREILEFTKGQISFCDQIEEKIKNRIIPVKYPDFILDGLNISTFELREKFINHMGFVLLSKMWIEALSIWIGSQKCLDVAANL